jgi:hypothetical protein
VVTVFLVQIAETTTSAHARLDWWVPASFAVGGLLCAWMDRGFRTGARVVRNTFAPGRPRRGSHALALYGMRPCTIGLAGFTLASVPAAIYGRPPAPVWPIMGVGFLLILCGFAWLWKEFERPTLSRTPAWLWDLMAQEVEIQIWVCGKRPLPPRPTWGESRGGR